MTNIKNTKPHTFEYKKHPEHKKIALKRILAWGLLLAFMSLAVFLVEQNIKTFQASIIPTKQAPAYDGLISPVDKVPNWVALTTEEWDKSYSELPISKLVQLPKYDPNVLRISTDSLQWGNPHDDTIRNAKITFSVPYMGNYKLDGIEYAGSHLAVDIKIPSGTPIYSIGNGIVVKTSEQAYGFGKHIVIEHKNFPSFDNANFPATYYSSYSHLNTINVTVGSIVRKGDIIGYAGRTGTATTNHLHFQIDNDSAPWHPFWPFTSKEASDAGLSFSQAVNEGLNQDIAIENTINPMLYVQKYVSGSVTSTTNTYEDEDEDTNMVDNNTETTSDTNTTEDTNVTENTNDSEDTTATENTNTEEEDSNITENESQPDISITDTFDDVSFVVRPYESSNRSPQRIYVQAVDDNGNFLATYKPETNLRIRVAQGTARLKQTALSPNDFTNGAATIDIYRRDSRDVELRIYSDTQTAISSTSLENIFSDISSSHPHFMAISFLKDEGVIDGYPDGTFKPENYVSRVEVLKFILEGIDTEMKTARSLPFNDTDANEWYRDYLVTGIRNQIIQGYPDHSFKPAETVNKVEFLKMLIKAMNIDINPNVKELPFTDVDENEWYAPYVQFAIEKNIIDTSSIKFIPDEQMRREDIAEAMYRIKLLTATGANKYTADLINYMEYKPA